MGAGLFKEGGLVGSPVSSARVASGLFANAPHFAEGTANTSGIPAVLHDNEAVIPLSRNRKVPVELNSSGGHNSHDDRRIPEQRKSGAPIINLNFNKTLSPDGFRRSKREMLAFAHSAGQAAALRS